MKPDFGQMFDFNGDGHVSDFERFFGFSMMQRKNKDESESEPYGFNPDLDDGDDDEWDDEGDDDDWGD